MDIIIVGGGKTGTYLASLLTEDGYRIRLIEARKDLVAGLRAQFGERDVILGNGADPLTLERAGILHADVVVAATGSDEVNLVVSTLAKMEYNVSRVVARVNDPANAWMFTPVNGVDAGINQAEITVRFIREGMNLRDMFTLMKLGRDEHSIVQATVNPGSRVENVPLSKIDFPDQTIVVAVDRNDSLTVPNGRTVLRAGDEAVLFCSREGRDAIRRLFA